MKTEPAILRLRVQLRYIEPAIWREIEVPGEYNFWDLHVAIQDAMGWQDSHLHAFRVGEGRNAVTIGVPDPDGFDDAPVLPGRKVPVRQYLEKPGQRVQYDYDFGDGWEHDVVLQEVAERRPRLKYPWCVGGARACPPEDCGGPPGYEELLETLSDPAHPEHASMLEWLGGPFDPEAFDPDAVRFDDPKKRWRRAYG